MTLEHAIWHFDWCFKVKKGEGGINPHVAHLQIWLVCFIFDPIKSYKFLENTSLKKFSSLKGSKTSVEMFTFRSLTLDFSNFSQSLNSVRVPEFQWHCTRIVPWQDLWAVCLEFALALHDLWGLSHLTIQRAKRAKKGLKPIQVHVKPLWGVLPVTLMMFVTNKRYLIQSNTIWVFSPVTLLI